MKSREGGLRGSIAAEESEGPIVHGPAIVEPVIRPSVEGDAAKPCFTAHAEGGGEKRGLCLFGIAGGIEAKFGEIDRTIAGEVMEAGKVAFE
jgi:hypothetical protein